MKFSELSEHFAELEKTASRNSMTEMLAQLFGEANEQEIEHVCFLALGQLGPLYERVDFQLADKMVMRGIARAFGVELTEVLKQYKAMGDLGVVAEGFKKQKTKNKKQEITVADVYERLMVIAGENGQGSQERKVEGLAVLLRDLDALGVRFMVRMVLSRLRLGFSDKTILDALCVMDGGSKVGREELEAAYQVFPHIGQLATLVKQHGIAGIGERVRVSVGVPVMPALCQRLKTAEEMIAKMGEVMVEPKFDGTRVQIHVQKRGGAWKVKTFTRNLDETTHMFPELMRALDQIDADTVILDSEAVGRDPKTGKRLPFQVTIQRKRKHGVEEMARTIPLTFNVFDVLYLNGRSLVGIPLQERRALLTQIIRSGSTLVVDEVVVTDSADTLRNYHAQKLSEGLEGVVVKQITSRYEPGRRGWSWVKFKEVEEAAAKLSDTVDAVVMGFYRGRGKRTQFGIGAFLVGVRGADEQVLTLAKVGTGLTDEQWKELKRRLEMAVSVEQPKAYVVDKNLAPDVWVDPTVVVEIAADEVTKSPIHSAGVALRFPRLISFRDDKNLEQATSVEEVKQIA